MLIWKDVVGFEGLYEVSNTGMIRGIDRYVGNNTGMRLVKGVIKPTRINKHGYLEVSISKEHKKYRKLVHRLVALAFIENKYNKPVVNHIDGNKTNNCVENLEWCTVSENTKHGFEKLNRVGQNGGMNKPVKMIDKKTNETIQTFNSITDAAKFINGSKQAITQAIKRQGISYDYKWEFIE